jgi:hypothetical protein
MTSERTTAVLLLELGWIRSRTAFPEGNRA